MLPFNVRERERGERERERERERDAFNFMLPFNTKDSYLMFAHQAWLYLFFPFVSTGVKIG